MKKLLLIILLLFVSLQVRGQIIAQGDEGAVIPMDDVREYCERLNTLLEEDKKIECGTLITKDYTLKELQDLCEEAKLPIDCTFTVDTINLTCYRLKLFNPSLDCNEDIWLSVCEDRSKEEKEKLAALCADQEGTKFSNDTCTCIDDPFTKFLPRTNFDGSIDDVSELVRLAFTIFFIIIAIVALFLGIYGMYVYTTAGEDAEKVQKAQKIFKNAIMGIAIAVLGILIVNVIFIFLGLDPNDVFTFNVSETSP